MYFYFWTYSVTHGCVFRGPLNEDVFVAPALHGGKIMDSDIQEISEQIHRLLLQVRITHLIWALKNSRQYLSVSVTIFSLFSLSITWALAVMVVMDPTSSW